MPDFNPSEMDALFREGAEKHEFEYNPSSWTLMEEKLDKKENKRKIFFLLLGLALFIGIVVSYSYLNSNEKNDQKVLATTSESDNLNKTNIEVESKVEDVAQIEIDNSVITPDNSVITNTKAEIQKENVSTDSKDDSSIIIGAQNSFQSENTGNLTGNEIVSIDSQIEPETQTYKEDVLSHNNIKLNTKEDLIRAASRVEKDFLTIPSLSKKEFEMFDLAVKDFIPLDLKPTQTSFAPVLLTNSNRFVLVIFANPEWSSVGLFRESKTGWSLGTKIGYQFSDKFEANIGIAISRKVYKSAGREYTMAGGWFNDIEPMRVDAKCDVIEIPMGLSYYLNGFRNSGFFADLGLNSYMLHSEWYGFKYDDAVVRPSRYYEVMEEDENAHLVGVGRIAIGYQAVLSNKTALQISPYVQFPLTGIGAGQLNLYSSGVQIAVNFNTN